MNTNTQIQKQINTRQGNTLECNEGPGDERKVLRHHKRKLVKNAIEARAVSEGRGEKRGGWNGGGGREGEGGRVGGGEGGRMGWRNAGCIQAFEFAHLCVCVCVCACVFLIVCVSACDICTPAHRPIPKA
jgi:hypothetical protein